MTLEKLNIFFKSGRELNLTPFHVEQVDEFKGAILKFRVGSGGMYTFTDIQPDDSELTIILDEIEFFTHKTIIQVVGEENIVDAN